MVPTNFQSNMMSFNPLSQNAVSGTNQTSPTLLCTQYIKSIVVVVSGLKPELTCSHLNSRPLSLFPCVRSPEGPFTSTITSRLVLTHKSSKLSDCAITINFTRTHSSRPSRSSLLPYPGLMRLLASHTEHGKLPSNPGPPTYLIR